MPTGFDGIESGAALPQRLVNLTDWLISVLQKQIRGVPLTGKEICSKCRMEKKFDLEGPDVRAMVNYLRRRSKPIGSVSDGYFWAIEKQELDSTILHLRERVAGISSALRGLEVARNNLSKGQQEMF
jgi:hypothetical protein